MWNDRNEGAKRIQDTRHQADKITLMLKPSRYAPKLVTEKRPIFDVQ